MRPCAFIVVLAATFVAGCGDSSTSATPSDLCSNGAVTDGDSCGTGKICQSARCVDSKCGDGIVAAGEECDDGNTVNGDGCDSSCKFSCLSSDSKRNCAPADACAGEGVCTDAHVCATGTPLADGHACGPGGGNVCNAGVCTSPLCGNGVRDFGEECDDGNKLNLDGCDSACKFEQTARITSLVQQFTPDDFCTKNALGGAIPDVAQSFIQSTWSFPVADGSLSLVFKFLGGIDPFGASSTFKLGFLKAAPIRFNPQDDGTFADGYDGNNDLDWWYLRDASSVDTTETPTVQLAGQVTNRHLTAGPGTISKLTLLFVLQPADVTLFNVRVDANLDIGVSHPLLSTAETPPGHLATEHLAPNLFQFVSSSKGAMCSDVSVQSLANTLMPGLLTLCADPSDPTGKTPVFFVNPDDPNDPKNNHLLDAFVFGCQLLSQDPVTGEPAFEPAFTPTQPDGSLNGSVYIFGFDAVTHQVISCTKDDQPGDLADCFANATYSSYFKFAADRVIVRRNAPAPSL